MTFTMMRNIIIDDDCGGDTKYDDEDDDINIIGGNANDCKAPLHDGRSVCSPNADPQWL